MFRKGLPKMAEKFGKEQALILVKAAPNITRDNRELVCCAGVTEYHEWRRQYPVRYRNLTERFRRWDWIEYEYHLPKLSTDTRAESRIIQEESIRFVRRMPQGARSKFLNNLIVPSTDFAAERGQTLALIRPIDPKFSWREKSVSEIASEKEAFERAANQSSFFDAELSALVPCPYSFRFEYHSEDGKRHSNECLDWEAPAAYLRFSDYGKNPKAGIARLESEYGDRYPKAGMAFALGTHSRRPTQWLLVGVIRLDESDQFPLI